MLKITKSEHKVASDFKLESLISRKIENMGNVPSCGHERTRELSNQKLRQQLLQRPQLRRQLQRQHQV